MIVDKPISDEEVKYCCDLYISQNDPSFFKVNPQICYNNLINHWRSLGYLSVIRKDNRIVAWINANELRSRHSSERFLMQEYYCSILSGFSAAKAVRLAHNDLIQEGLRRKVDYVMSIAGPKDPTCVLTRILEKDGWIRRGHIAKYNLK